jgi:tetratricopeptide (TPR) repeat protein
VYPQLRFLLARGLAPALLCLSFVACQKAVEDVGTFPIEQSSELERNSLRSEAKVLRIEQAMGEALAGMEPGRAGSFGGAFSKDFVARWGGMAKAEQVPDSDFVIQVLQGPVDQITGAQELLSELDRLTAGWSSIERRSVELDRFYLEPGGERATGRCELYLAGELKVGGRADFRLVAEVALEDTMGGWCLTQLDLVEAISISGSVQPFVDITASSGFSLFRSFANRSMLQSFIDEHRVLALGGMSAVDWNQDGQVDIVVTLDGSSSVVYINDGHGGFIPHQTPVQGPADCGVMLLRVDLDGDGVDELVNSRELAYSGSTGHFGLYTQEGEEWVFHPEALEFENPVGLRGIKTQTIVPFDVNGDGLLDLYFGVYGSSVSRGDDYNLVEAHDGGNNYLFINQGDLKFKEETVERGISGVQYTYVALPFDFDGDGDVDLFEGNDFGHNVLWLNDGKGFFSRDDSSPLAKDSAYTMGVSLSDHDDDGDYSLYVVNMSSEAGGRIGRTVAELSDPMRDRVLTIANGNWIYSQDSEGTWIEHAAAARCAEGEWGWGAMFCDLDGDGDDDLFAVNGFTSHADPKLGDWDSYFWRQVCADARSLERGTPSFDVNAESPFVGSYAGHQRNRLFYQADGDSESFYDTAWHYGLDHIEDGRCLLPVDVDGDGDLDLALYTLQGLRLYQNQSPSKPFARLRLKATQTHPSAMGARVRITAGDRVQYDTVQLVEGFQSQQVLELNFSWDQATRVDEVRVDWPSGEQQTFKDLPIGELLTLVEGDPEASNGPVARWAEGCTLPDELSVVSAGRPTLPKNPSAQEAAPIRVERFGSNSEAGWLLRDALAMTFPEVQFNTVDWDGPQGSLFVYDSSGRLCRAFFKEPGARDLELFLSQLEDEAWYPRLAILTGRRALREGKAEVAQRLFESALEEDPRAPSAAEGLARAHRFLGQLDEAEAAYKRSVEIDPDYALGHFNLAVLHLRTDRAELALESFEQTLRIRGEHYETLLAMGEAKLLAGQPDGALETFARAGSAQPTQAEPFVLRGKLLGQLGRLEGSIQAFSQALELAPKDQGALRGLEQAQDLLDQQQAK